MPSGKANDKKFRQVYFASMQLPGSSNAINKCTSQISTLVEDSNAEKGKIKLKNWITRFVFEKE